MFCHFVCTLEKSNKSHGQKGKGWQFTKFNCKATNGGKRIIPRVKPFSSGKLNCNLCRPDLSHATCQLVRSVATELTTDCHL